MRITLLLSFLFIALSSHLFSQNQISVRVVEKETMDPILGARVLVENAKPIKNETAGLTDKDGRVTLNNVLNGTQNIIISYPSFGDIRLELIFPLASNEEIEILMEPSDVELEEVLVEATRANKSISNLPTRTEVLTEEIDEAATMEPSRISHLITHSTGIQVQTTSATSNGAVVRIQGLNGRYTQILKDGFPLYGGFSGSLDILQIPPLDLRQVEYIKGSASTLYGGGAIGGIVNLVSKRPSNDVILHANISHIGGRDFNAYMAKSLPKFGFTTLASTHIDSPYDVDDDGYSDVPKTLKINFNPKFFFFPDAKTEISAAAFIGEENRLGGDLKLINDQNADTNHFYFDSQNTNRFTTQFFASRAFNKANTLTAKNSVSSYNRSIQIRQNQAGDISSFQGNQLSTYSELNYQLNKTRHNLNIGLNVYSDKFIEEEVDSSLVRNQSSFSYGGYINYLWDIHEKFALESGFRADYASAKTLDTENKGELFLLPRLSTLYKMNKHISLRLGGGMGYRMPTIFNEEAEPYGFKNVLPIDYNNVKAERSYGANFDFKYQSTFGSKNVLLTFNQMFFYNLIENTIQLYSDTTNMLYYANSTEDLNTRGFESQIKLTVWKFTWFFGYTYTDAFYMDGSSSRNMVLNPPHSIKGDILFVIENKWRIGLDYEYKSEQYLSNGSRSPALFTSGIVVERRIQNFVIFLNAENYTDTRQTRYEGMLSGVNNTPQFTEVWAPQDGFFFNGGIKINL